MGFPDAALGRLHAAFYLVGGAWPLLAYRSFEAVTGAKREPWLVKTVGMLTMLAGAIIAADASGSERSTRRLAIGTALSFAAVDGWYAGVRRRIRPIYLLDAVAELGLAAAWLARRHPVR
jgi:hypothetical protein